MINVRYLLPNLSSEQIFMTKLNLKVFTRQVFMLSREPLFCQYGYAFQKNKFLYGFFKTFSLKKE